MECHVALRKLRPFAPLLMLLTFASNIVHAVPITYKLLIASGAESGTLNGVPFSNAVLTFTFESDTANVFPWSIALPSGTSTGYDNTLGTASVQIVDITTGATLQATFQPSAGIFVSLDNTNGGGGVGFGSFKLPLSDPNFPGQPAYPYAMFGAGPNGGNLSTYDLKSDFTSDWAYDISCVNFPAGCGVPLALSTTAGDLYVNSSGLCGCARFTAQTHPVTPFASFNALGQVGRNGGSFSLAGIFSLGTGSNGINPAAEALTLQFGTYSLNLPAGAFNVVQDGRFLFRGSANGGFVQIQITPLGTNRYSIRAYGRGNLNGITLPTTLMLTLGDDSGTTTVTASRGDD